MVLETCPLVVLTSQVSTSGVVCRAWISEVYFLSAFLPAHSARSVLLTTSRSLCVMPGPPSLRRRHAPRCEYHYPIKILSFRLRGTLQACLDWRRAALSPQRSCLTRLGSLEMLFKQWDTVCPGTQCRGSVVEDGHGEVNLG